MKIETVKNNVLEKKKVALNPTQTMNLIQLINDDEEEFEDRSERAREREERRALEQMERVRWQTLPSASACLLGTRFTRIFVFHLLEG